MSWLKLWGRAGGVPPVAGGLFQIHAGIYNYIQVHTFAIVECLYIYNIQYVCRLINTYYV